MKKGFTLIELLVVVLIIGILASIALPQYKKAVDKARLAKYLPLAKNIQQAQNVYYLGNNTYAESLLDLEIDFSKVCRSVSSQGHVLFNCQDPVSFDNYQFGEGKELLLRYSYPPSQDVTDYHDLWKKDQQILTIHFPYMTHDRQTPYCESYNSYGIKLCQTLNL